MQRNPCPCGGTCRGNIYRCENNVRLQQKLAEALERRGATLHVVGDDPGEDIEQVVQVACERRSA
jgi:hypothetical protein